MRVLLDIVHPADVLFFRRPIARLRERGDEVLLVSRDKDVTLALLEALQLPHSQGSRAGNGVVGLGIELLHRIGTVVRLARDFRPDVMAGFGAVAIAYAGRLVGIPAIAFYDSENARLQTRVTWPLIHHLYVPESYRGRVPGGRVTRVPGTKELSHLHPNSFVPDRELAIRNGLDPYRPNYLLRVVAWRANHDFGKQGWPSLVLGEVAAALSARGRLHISSEVPLPTEFEPFRYRADPAQIHQLMAHCRLVVGESATMSCEAVTLGVPAVYGGHDFPGYVRELEAAGLLTCVPPRSFVDIPAIVDAELSRPMTDFRQSLAAYLAGKPDWAEVIVQALDAHAHRVG